MTDEQINQHIAETCGICHSGEHGPLYKTDQGWVVNCPNYCTDLNAMHEAEKTLRGGEWDTYVDLLADTWIQVAHATARQRAGAFLRTLGKWEETQK